MVKKLFALAVTLVLVMCMSSVAFAVSVTCPECGENFKIDDSNADCEDVVSAIVYCDECEINVEVDVPAIGHNFVKKATHELRVTEKTCIAPATYYMPCDRAGCKAHSAETFSGEAIGDHVWGNWTVGKAPTCTEDGYSEAKCTTPGCNEVKTGFMERDKATGHNWVEDTAAEGALKSEADCENAAVYYKTCSTCGEVDKNHTFVDGVALGHDWETTPAVEATCTSEGMSEHIECKRCHHVHQQATVIQKAEHNFVADATVEGALKAEATCKSPALYYKSCSVCGEIDTNHYFEYGQNVSHKWTDWTITDATCDEAGSKVRTCQFEGCKAKNTEEIPALGHDWETTPAVEATCTSEGMSEHIECKRCHHVHQQGTVIEKTAHNFVKDTTAEGALKSEADCENAAWYYKTCADCGEVDLMHYFADGEALGHKWVDTPAVPATCYSEGMTMHSECSVCQKVRAIGTVIEKLPHTKNWKAAKDATCDEDGHNEYWYCIVEECGAVDENMEVIPATGHKFDKEAKTAAAIASQPTCLVPTQFYYTCSNGCGEINKEEGAPTFTNGVYAACDTENILVPATCTADGRVRSVCKVCGTVYSNLKDKNAPALGHDFSVEVEATAPDCTNAGLTAGVKCSRCDVWETEQEEIPALGHTEVIDAAVPATCTETGLTEGKHCEVCDEVIVAQEVVAALGHAWVEEIVAADCVNTGLKTSTCQNDPTHVYTEVIPALGHTMETVPGKKATCTQKGYDAYEKCSVCGHMDDEIEYYLAAHEANVVKQYSAHQHQVVCDGPNCDFVFGYLPHNKLVWYDWDAGFQFWGCTVCGYQDCWKLPEGFVLDDVPMN